MMHLYEIGDVKKTIVLLSGGTVCAPIFEYKKLMDCLSKSYRVILIEKFGYGYSDIIEGSRGIADVVSEMRDALKAYGINEKIILMAHSMGFLEAIFWAQNFKDDIECLIGLSPAVPQTYDTFLLDNIMHFSKVIKILKRIGLLNIIPTQISEKAIF